MKGSFSIVADWAGDGLSPAKIGAKVVETLDGLGAINPTPPDWRLNDPLIHFPMPEDADFDEAIYEALSDYEGATHDRLLADPTKFVEDAVARDDLREPEPVSGYKLRAWDQQAHRENRSSLCMKINIGAGSTYSNGLQFKVGDEFDPLANNARYDLHHQALEHLAATWPCPWAHVRFCPDIDQPMIPVNAENFEAVMADIMRSANEPQPDHLVQWMVYLSARYAKDLTPPSALIAEPTPGGGLILSATKDRLDIANPDHMHRAAILAQTLHHFVPHGRAWNERPPAARIGPY